MRMPLACGFNVEIELVFAASLISEQKPNQQSQIEDWFHSRHVFVGDLIFLC